MRSKLLISVLATGLFFCASPAFAAEDIVAKAEKESQAKVVEAKALLMAPPKGNEPSTTLRDTLATMYSYNPDIQAARANVKAVAENLSIAMSDFLPDVTGDADVTRSDRKISGGNLSGTALVSSSGFGEGDGTSKAASVNAVQPLFRGGQSVAEKREAENGIAAAVAGQKATIQDQITAAIAAHVDVKRAEAVLELNTQNQKRLTEQLRATKLRYEVGELTRTDVSQAEARLSESEAELTMSRAALRTARAEYRRIVGREPVGLIFPDMMPKLPPSLDEAKAQAMRFNPLLQQAYFQTNAARKQVESARGAALPTVGLQAGYGKIYDPVGVGYEEETNNNIGVVASIPLYQGGADMARIRQSKAQARQQEQTERATLEQVNRDVIAAWEDYGSTKAEMKAREKQLAAAALALKSIQLESEVGQRTIIDVLDAEQEYLEAQTELVTTQRNEVVNAYALAAAIGMLDPISMQLDPKFPDAATVIRRQRKGF